MKKLFYRVAKSFVEKYDSKQANIIAAEKQKYEAQESVRKEKLKRHTARLNEHTKKYIDEVKERFMTNSAPLFKVGDLVVTNWYGNGDSWEGSMKMLQQHTPHQGPINVEIIGVGVDVSQLSEVCYNLTQYDGFYYIDEEVDYDTFKRMVDAKSREDMISWAYRIKVQDDDKVYWHYTFRQHHFLNIDSDIARWSKEAYNLELAHKRVSEQQDILMQNIYDFHEKITNNKILRR